ncbi:MAG: HYR domain-containing protein [Bacteroidetes bacterium]|nr:MAG: HYR domain-containing protein [Bacteroidota bacterium]
MATISNCAFLRNTATGYGGGLSIGATASTNIIDKCVFAGNQSAEGGGIKIIDYSATITSSLFLGNKSVGVGGGISTQGIAYTTTATNCTFSGNSSSSGGAIHTLSSTSVLLNSILWGNGNSTEIAHSGPGSTTATYSIIQGGYAGAGNLNVDPLFVSQPDHLTAPTTAGDLHLQICSPAIDAGTNAGAPANDLDGNARPFPATDTDMGAFEFQGLQQIPVALCQNVTVELNSMGNGGTSASSLDNGSTGCAPLVLTINGMNNLNFTCSDKGPNTYTLTVTDALGVTATCTAVVTVKDNVAPMALCKNVAINLNAAGNGNLSSAQVNNGSLDACGINSTAVSPSLFNCTNVGMNTVTLTVTDDSGNSKTCTAKVTVNDITPPAPLCQNLTVELNGAGMATVTPGQVDNNSSDACGIKSLGLSKTDFKCVDVGLHTVTLTVTDNNDNTNTCTATVTISDKTPPQAQCQNVMLDLNNSNNGVITPGQVDNGSSDNCGVKSLALSQDQFGCGDLGMHTVTLTVTDDNNNTNTCTAKVTVTNALAVFDVIGGSFCTDDVDATVSLSGSETGVSYQLKRNGINTGAPVPGTGSLLDFGMQPTGSYTVVASSDICGNTAEMNGPAQVVAGPCDISVPDHCDCEDPSGRTPVTLKVSALPGQTWTVKAVIGLYDTSSPALPAPQTPLAVDTPLTYIGGDMYTLNVYRLNNKGYYVVLTNGDSDRDIQVGNPSW